MPRKIEVGKPAKFNFDLAAPKAGWKQEARVRIQVDQDLGTGKWNATFNGQQIDPTADVAEPFPVAYPSMLAEPSQLRAWRVPAALLREGKNSLEVTLTDGAPLSLVFVDLAFGQSS